MSNHNLVLRQQRLRIRSAQLRQTLTGQAVALQRPLALIDQVRSGLQWLYRNPQWPLGAVLVLVLVRPRRAMVWGARLWWGWKTFTQTKRWLASTLTEHQRP